RGRDRVPAPAAERRGRPGGPAGGAPVRRRDLLGALLAASLALPLRARAQAGLVAEPRGELIDGGPYVPTPDIVVERMLELARVRKDDLVVDLGSGDGRLVIEAARRYGARGVGVEREAQLVTFARAAAQRAEVA